MQRCPIRGVLVGLALVSLVACGDDAAGPSAEYRGLWTAPVEYEQSSFELDSLHLRSGGRFDLIVHLFLALGEGGSDVRLEERGEWSVRGEWIRLLADDAGWEDSLRIALDGTLLGAPTGGVPRSWDRNP